MICRNVQRAAKSRAFVVCNDYLQRLTASLALRHSNPLVEVEAAVVGTVGDKHHLMTAAIGEDDEITGLGGSVQADFMFGAVSLSTSSLKVRV